jgi:hypothetical protein
VRRVLIVLATVFLGVSLSACTHTAARPQRPAPSGTLPLPLSLRCSDSVGQQGQDHETVVGGVEGLVLPGSDDPAGLIPIRAGDGTRYYLYKAFLAVSAASAPFATVAITQPAGARLWYGSPARIGALLAAGSGQALVAASRSTVRLPVCGPRFTGFVGGIIVSGPACVTFVVSSPSSQAATVRVPIGPGRC